MPNFFLPNSVDGGSDSFEITRGGNYFIVNKIWKRNGEIAHSGAKPFKTQLEAEKYVQDLFSLKIRRDKKYDLINYNGKTMWTSDKYGNNKELRHVRSYYVIDGYIVEDLHDGIVTHDRKEAEKMIQELGQ